MSPMNPPINHMDGHRMVQNTIKNYLPKKNSLIKKTPLNNHWLKDSRTIGKLKNANKEQITIKYTNM